MSKKLILKINEKGLLVSLPGMSQFRTPATIDVSHIPLQTLIFKLNESNVRDYELISHTDNKKIVYKKESKKEDVVQKQVPSDLPDEYIDSLNKKFNRLENMMGKLLNNTTVTVKKSAPKEEQINKRLDRIEKMLKEQPKQVIIKSDSEKLADPKIEDDDDFGVFIPNIETEGMKLSGGEHKEIESDFDADGAADALSSLLNDDETEE